MKRILPLLCLLLLGGLSASYAQKGKRPVVDPYAKSEQALINKLEGCLAEKDAECYIKLWPGLDTLTMLVMQYSDSSSADFQEAQSFQNDPVRIMRADSFFNARLRRDFDSLIKAGEELGIHWESIIPVRYELIKQRETRERLFEKLAPTRFLGYLFFADATTRRSYGLMVGDIMEINKAYYGGKLGEVYEASNRDEWDEARYYLRKHPESRTDTTRKAGEHADEDHQERNKKSPEIIAERKLYTGYLDNEIPIQLYVRSLKGGCPQGICSWEAIYKFGDQDEWVLLNVTRSEGDKWQFVEAGSNGSMDLVMKGKTYNGDWATSDGQTGYDVKVTEAPISEKKTKRLDEIFGDLKK
jgi:hypothetical protein